MLIPRMVDCCEPKYAPAPRNPPTVKCGVPLPIALKNSTCSIVGGPDGFWVTIAKGISQIIVGPIPAFR